MKNKKGFISMALVYSFLIVFLFIMLAILSCYEDKNKFLEAIDDKIAIDIGLSKEGKSTLKEKILNDNPSSSMTDINTTKGNGLFYEELSNGTRIYFFRGDVDNNYVLFGNEYQNKNGFADKTPEYNRICWRVLRTNDDGTIRLVYSGVLNSEGKCTNEAYIKLPVSSTSYNIQTNDNAYVGYTYAKAGVVATDTTVDAIDNARIDTHYYTIENIKGKNVKVSNDSEIKKSLEQWYKEYTNLFTYSNIVYGDFEEIAINSNYMADSKYCADRITNASNNGYGVVETIYGARIRMTGKPKFSCDKSEDIYSLSISTGGLNNNVYAITAPVGLLTADEVRYAGGALNVANTEYFLYSNQDYWTMSPDGYYTTQGAKVFYVKSDGSISSSSVSQKYKIRPVISVSTDALINKGTGTIDAPYEIG